MSRILLSTFLGLLFSVCAVVEAGEQLDPIEVDPSALYADALAHLNGTDGVEKSRLQAIALLKQAAKAEYAEAYNLLGVLYVKGNGFFRSLRKGNRMFEAAAALNDPSAIFNLGYSYRFGRGVKEDFSKAEEYFLEVVEPTIPHRIAADSFDLYRNSKAAAYYYLGGLYTDEELLGEDFEKAVAYMVQAEELGSSNAAIFLAVQYALGKNIEKDSEKGEYYLDRYALLVQNDLRVSMNKTFFRGMDQDMDEFLKEMGTRIADDLDDEVENMKVSFGISLMDGEDEDIYDPAMAARWLELASEDGKYARLARIRLARLYYRGEGVEQNLEKARGLLERSRSRSSLAHYNLGVMLIHGEGGDVDVEGGRLLIEEAAKRDLYVAQLYLDDGVDLEYCSFEEAKDRCEDAANTEDVRAQYSLGMRYLFGSGVDWDRARARELIEVSAKAGYAPAQYRFATNFTGVMSDHMFTMKWIKASAEQGYLPAKHRKADWMSRGRYFEKDLVGAVALLEECVAEGYPDSMTRLGMLYREGMGVDKDLGRSFELLTQATEKEDSIGMMRLAEAYRDGLGVDVDIERAFDLMERAAEAGSINAYYEVGEMYSKGLLGEVNWEEAVDWYKKAGDYRHKLAWMRLGDCYKNGEGVGRSRLQALEWYAKVYRVWWDFDSRYEIAMLHAEPDWAESNASRALDEFRQLEMGAYPLAAFQLGMFNAKGIVLLENPKKAISKWRRVARYGDYDLEADLKGHAAKVFKKNTSKLTASNLSDRAAEGLAELAVEALYLIGESAYEGRGIKKDGALALALFELAANEGHGGAAYKVAIMYRDGVGVEASSEDYVLMLKRAAELDNAEALYELGRMYFEDEAGLASKDEALDCLERAGKQGHLEARRLFEKEGGEPSRFAPLDSVDPEGDEGWIEDIQIS